MAELAINGLNYSTGTLVQSNKCKQAPRSFKEGLRLLRLRNANGCLCISKNFPLTSFQAIGFSA